MIDVAVILNPGSGTAAGDGDAPEGDRRAVRRATGARRPSSRPPRRRRSTSRRGPRSRPGAGSRSPPAATARSTPWPRRVLGRDIPLGVLPTGTLNHFAKDLGIPLELAEAVRVACAGRRPRGGRRRGERPHLPQQLEHRGLSPDRGAPRPVRRPGRRQVDRGAVGVARGAAAPALPRRPDPDRRRGGRPAHAVRVRGEQRVPDGRPAGGVARLAHGGRLAVYVMRGRPATEPARARLAGALAGRGPGGRAGAAQGDRGRGRDPPAGGCRCRSTARSSCWRRRSTYRIRPAALRVLAP